MASGKHKGGPTPMMTQYLGIKAQHPEAILLFRMGDFYETFYDDARICAEVLGITLTSREKRGDQPIPLAGIPFHAVDHYMVKLMSAGLTVAICEQTEDPALAKGLVKREVVEILSPGTITNPAFLDGADSSYLLALAEGDTQQWGFALLDGSTGEFRCGEGETGEVFGLARRYRVAEILLPSGQVVDGAATIGSAAFSGISASGVSPLLFGQGYATQTLCEHFAVHDLAGLGLAESPLAVCAAGAALRYLTDRQRSRPHQVSRLELERDVDRLHLDRETVAHLELFESLRPGERDATLFRQIDATRCAMGRRCLAAWLRSPLTRPAAIEARLDAVAQLQSDPRSLEDLRESLRGIGDVERILGRVATARAMPHELGALRAALLKVPRVLENLPLELPPQLEELRDALLPAVDLAAPLSSELVEEPPVHLRQGGVMREGVHADLDELLALSRGGKSWLAAFQQSERERSGIPSLKVAYNRVFGYYVEITRAHFDKIPEDYQEKQTLANGKRFVTQALKEKERQILSAEDRRVALEVELFARLVETVGEQLVALRLLAQALGRLDAFAGLASLATARNWVRPQIDESSVLDIENGRHPVVERLVGDPFVPNGLRMDPEAQQLLLLTGPNMGGKSTYLRQTALFVVLAQMGSFVPATRARIGIVDRLFTRVGASDNLARGQSTFLVEMSETAKILRGATARSLVILDEVGRGTSTNDGLALAWAITEYLHDGSARPKTLFATHFHELTQLAESLARAANLQMEVKEWEGEILFLHRVVPGASDRSYGIHVAELAGVPRPVLERAAEILSQREQAGAVSIEAFQAPPPSAAPQLPLFRGPEDRVLERLREADLDHLRPLEALRLLDELQRRLEASGASEGGVA